jgi:hypothetical protein
LAVTVNVSFPDHLINFGVGELLAWIVSFVNERNP